MSFSEQLSRSFFEPLVGKTTTFLLDGRGANLEFARGVTGLLGAAGTPCAILDLDALYSSNASLALAPLTGSAASSVISVPPPGSPVEEDFSMLFDAVQDVLIIDSLNSLYHLFSMDDGGSRGRQVTLAIAGLSFFAKTNSKAVLLSMYKREGFHKPKSGRPISALSDVTASVGVGDGLLTVRTERGVAWPGGLFSIRIPSV